MMSPYAVSLKNKPPVLVYIDAMESTEKDFEETIASLVDDISKNDIVDIRCLCQACQQNYMGQMIELIALSSNTLPDPNFLLKVVPSLPDNDPMKKNWTALQHLVMGFVALQKHANAFVTVEEIKH